MKTTFIQALVVGLMLIGKPNTGHAAPLNSHEAAELAATYGVLLLNATQTQSSQAAIAPHQSLFASPNPLSEGAIETATRSLGQLLVQHSLPNLVSRMLLLEKIRTGEPLSGREKYSILKELDSLNELFEERLAEQDQALYRRSILARSVGSTAAALGGLVMTQIHSWIPNPDLAWTLPASISIVGAASLSLAYHQCNHEARTAMSCQDTRTWYQQFKQLGSSTDRTARERINHGILPLPSQLPIDFDHFPLLPHYTDLLNWVSIQPAFNSRSLIDENLDTHPANHEIVIHIPEDPAAQPVPVTNSVATLIEKFRAQEISDADFNRLNPSEFQAAVLGITRELNRQSYSLWTHLASRRIVLLALKKKDPDALFTILKSRIPFMLPSIDSSYRGFYSVAFLLATEKNHPELLRLLTQPTRNPTWTARRLMLTLDGDTLARARQIAERNQWTTISEILTLSHLRRRAAAGATTPADQIMPNAGHTGAALTSLHAAIEHLRALYAPKIHWVFGNRTQPAQIRQALEGRLNELEQSGRLTSSKKRSILDLLDLIDEPLIQADGTQEPASLYRWDTEEKKKRTRELLQIAVLALDDRAAFQRLHKRAMSPVDRDDNWIAWLDNALYDSAHAYAIDKGQAPNAQRMRNESSCVDGVNHRIIYGLSQLHPDINLDGGQTAVENEARWRNVVDGAKRNAQARFERSIYDTLIDEWVQRGVPISQDDAQVISDYKEFVTQRARQVVNEDFISTDEFRNLIQVLEDQPEIILARARGSRAT